MKEWGEEGWIEYLAKNFPSTDSICGIGDDCAVIPKDEEMAWLVTTDALVEGVHFLKDQISAKDLGYKAIAVNVSDIAAMGGCPKYAFLSIAFPKSTPISWAAQLMEGLKEASLKWNLLLLGGDTVGSKRDLFINITLIGEAERSKIKYRSSAQMGDKICVTRNLGDSAGGLQALQETLLEKDEIRHLMDAHFHPEIDLEQSHWLASQSDVHAMMDLSDGLDCDLRRLLKSSEKGAVIEVAKIPLSKSLLKVCESHQWDPLRFALFGGEDYCLLLTVSSDRFDEIEQAYRQKFQKSLHAIGVVTHLPSLVTYQKEGQAIEIHYPNFNHFE